MNKQMKNVFCILLTAMMLFAQCSYALGEQAAEADTPILMGINEDMLYVWAEKLGFSKIVLPKGNLKAALEAAKKAEIIGAQTLGEALREMVN